MFDKLKKAFSNAARSISQKELSEKDFDKNLFDLQIALLESDVSQEVIDDLFKQIKNNLIGTKIQKNETSEQIITSTLKNNFMQILSKTGSIDLPGLIREKKQRKGGPFVIVFLGINGTGKTTTVSKVANMLKKFGFSVVIAAADTHRAGAIEQITEHAERLSIKIISQRYGADPSAVSRDALEYAKKHYVDVVLIDTAGRMQTAKNLMYEIGKIVKVIKPDIKLFVGDSLSGNDTINQAREFFSFTEFDGAILTKADADAKGGAAISISFITSKPILYLGMGQGYDDLVLFDKEKFVDAIFNTTNYLPSTEEVPLKSNPAIEKHIDPYISLESNHISKFNEESDLIYEKDAVTINSTDNILKDQNNNIETTTPRNFEYSEINDKFTNEMDSNKINAVESSNDDAINSNTIDLETSNSDYKNGNITNDIEKLNIEEKEKEKENTEGESEKSEKKGLFGWFKKKK
ncbi:MAG: signal recognition particle-docking protein FtsY [Candidatus Nitrosocosmicus sp.]